MTNYQTKLELARKATVLTEQEASATGGSYFNEDMGLWIRQDSDGGGIMPFAWQMSSVRGGVGEATTIRALFADLGLEADIDAYDKSVLESEAKRGDYGLKD